MDKYYRTQLALLRNDANRFAKQYPALAPMLLGQGNDPDVERILEGTAYLCGKIQEKLDTGAPEFITALLRLVFPQALLPLPSMANIAFSLHAGFQEQIFIPAGTQLASKPVDGVSCLYSTMQEMSLLPLSIQDISPRMEEGYSCVQLTLASPVPLASLFATNPLILHCADEYATAVQHFFALQTQLAFIRVHTDSASYTLPASALRPRTSTYHDPRLTAGKKENRAYMSLLHFFTAPQQQLFLTLEGLARVLDAESNKASITFFLQKPFENIPPFSASSFALHVVPAMNIFDASAVPVRVEHTQEEYPITVLNGEQNFLEILDINTVKALEAGGTVTNYREYEAFRAEYKGKLYTRRIYTTKQNATPQYLIAPLYSPQETIENLAPSTLSISLRCCNHTLPLRLNKGDICMPTDTSPAKANFTNINKPSPHFPRCSEESRLWRLMTYLNTNLLSMASAESLRSLLELFIMENPAAPEYIAVNIQRCASIQEFSAMPEERLYKGHIMRGVHLHLELARQNFISHADMRLFIQTLDEFLATFAPMNTYSRVSVSIQGTGEYIQCLPRLGERQMM
jgi:type VI secretion system protein ImpG